LNTRAREGSAKRTLGGDFQGNKTKIDLTQGVKC
jgi:hypothetical protein